MNDTYAAWKKHLSNTPDGRQLDLMTPEQVGDAFSGNIVFGTGGLRGIMGLGVNRINRYTIERVTHGLVKTILSQDNPRSVCVSYDTRENSEEYAHLVCELLSAYGIDAHIFGKPMPTPVLSFAIRFLKLGWGVAITASHNPQEYNGYKVYDSKGVQLTDQMAIEVTNAIETVGFFKPVPEGLRLPIGVISPMLEASYSDYIVSYAKRNSLSNSFSMVYSALHGAGANVIPAVLEDIGFSPILTQQNPDSSFGGLKTPNPEEPDVYADAISVAERTGAKLLCATDPDCDRVGVMVKTERGFRLLNGNQIGALLIDFLAQTRGISPGDTVVTTVVSGFLGELVAISYGLEFKRLLTGFKYIGEYAERLPENKRFFFGYEESYGFLAGDGVRDKDAVIATALIAQMADMYDQKGMTLLDRWEELSLQHGFCLEELRSAVATTERQKKIMDRLRGGTIIDGLVRIEDYLPGVDGLPPSDLIKLYFDDGGWAAIRPSGTEPKIKLYTGAFARDHDTAKNRLLKLTDMLTVMFGIL